MKHDTHIPYTMRSYWIIPNSSCLYQQPAIILAQNIRGENIFSFISI